MMSPAGRQVAGSDLVRVEPITRHAVIARAEKTTTSPDALDAGQVILDV